MCQQRLAARQFGFGLLKLQFSTGHLRVELTRELTLLLSLSYCQCQRAGRARQCYFVVGGVQSYQHLTRLDALRVIGQQRHHRAGGLRGDANLVAGDIGIVGGLAPGEYQQPQQQPAQGQQ